MRLRDVALGIGALGCAALAIRSGPFFGVLGAPTGTWTPPPFGVAVNGTWSSYLNTFSTTTDSTGTTALVNVQSLDGPFGTLIQGTVNGTAAAVNVQLESLGSQGTTPSTLTLKGARINRIDFPVADVNTPGVLFFAAKVFASQTATAPEGPTPPGTQSSLKYVTGSHFRVAID